MPAFITYKKLRNNAIYDVDLEEEPHLRWRRVARENARELRSLMKDVERCAEQEVVARIEKQHGSLAARAARLLGNPIAWAAKTFANIIGATDGAEYVAEIQGIADAADVDSNRLFAANLMYDLTQAYVRYFASACSSFSCNLPDRTPVLARNMDWDTPDSVGRHTILVRFHKGDRSYLSVGVLGMVGVLSAMYPGHWVVTLNQAPSDYLGIRWTQWPALQRLRAACDGFGDFKRVVSRIQRRQTMSPFFAHVVGVSPDQHVIVNGFGDSYGTRKMAQGDRFLVQTNHFAGKYDTEDYNPPDSGEDEDGEPWEFNTRPRYDVLQRRLNAVLPASIDDAVSRLQRSPVTNECTMQKMAFCPATGDWRLLVNA